MSARRAIVFTMGRSPCDGNAAAPPVLTMSTMRPVPAQNRMDASERPACSLSAAMTRLRVSCSSKPG